MASPARSAPDTTTEHGGVDPYIVAAIIAVVVLVGVGAWFIGRSDGDTETETTIDNRP